MKPMSEVFELPVTFRPIKSKDISSDFDYVVIDNHGADAAECYSYIDGQHAAHAINSHDTLVDHLDNALNYIYELESMLDESGIDLADIDNGVLSQHCLDYQAACAVAKQARGE